MSPEPEPEAAKRYRIGYALPPKKLQDFLRPSLLEYANQHGIDLIPIDLNTPLTEQGHFHFILHKLQAQDWSKLQLSPYLEGHPDTHIFDPPELVEQVHDRVSMLDAMSHLKISVENDTVSVPNQILVDSNVIEEELDLDLTLHFPVIAKPLLVDGTASSHKLCLVFDREGLKTLNDNNKVVLQEFVNHGGVVFKVYVAGEHVKCVKRRSLPDITEEKAVELKGVVKFSLISNNGNDVAADIEMVEMPNQGLVTELARALREAMGLNLFNVDVIRDSKDPNRYMVIDINYFPGFAKLPGYEAFITDFLLDCVKDKIAAGNEVGEGGSVTKTQP